MQRRDKARFQWQTLELQRAEKDVDEMRSELETLEKNVCDCVGVGVRGILEVVLFRMRISLKPSWHWRRT